MIDANGLIQLGFKPLIDFVLIDHGDGIVSLDQWLSEQPQPTEAEIEAAAMEHDRVQPILKEMKRLESQVTPRRLREAALGDITFIQDIENQIAALRVQL